MDSSLNSIFLHWSSGNLRTAYDDLSEFCRLDPDWWVKICDADAPAGFIDMMFTIDVQTDDLRIVTLDELFAASELL